MREAQRLHQVSEYYFSAKLREVAQMKAAGKAVLNIGIGSPDLAPDKTVIEALSQTANSPSGHGYQSYQGTPELRTSMADFYKKRFEVSLDADSEVLPMMGSKEAIMHISMAFLNPGDKVLIPNPGYPTYQSVTDLVGATPILYDLEDSNHWFPDFQKLEQSDLSSVKLMWLNYPHMPTGTAATEDLFAAVVAFAKKHDILVINDNPYAFILSDSPKSILGIPGAKTHCLELNSLSKTFNMAGWRVGMLLGASDKLASVLKVKSNMDSGMFLGLQKGAIAALSLEDEWFENLNAVYRERRAWVFQIMEKLGCRYDQNAVGLFVWAKCPSGVSADDLVDDLLYNHEVFVTPGHVFGSQGKDYIRISLCAEIAVYKEVLNRIQ